MNANEPTLPEESLFMQALEIDSPDERAAFLDKACQADAALRNDVEALLRHHREGTRFLETPPTEVVVATEQLTTNEAESPALDFLSPSHDAHSLGRLGYYEVLEVLGHGGFGVVLKARDTKLDRIVAVKTLAQSLASSATARKRFVREAKAAAAVKHENVVGIYHVADDGPVPYLVMECVGGVSLETKLKQVGTLDLPAILRIGMQVASGLAAAHKQGLVHRDVKPGNILLENGVERVKITDFGLARAADDAAITRTGEVAGTPQYMSPEQAQGLTLDARSDLFSLGSVLYAMSTGRSPFRAESTIAALRRVCDDTPRPIREINADIPEWLVGIISRLLAKQPSERFQTATEVADLLALQLAEVQRSATVPSPKPTVVSQRRPLAIGSRWWSVALISLLAAACAIGLTEASGVTKVLPTVIRIVRGEGTLVIEVDDPTVQVSLDGEELSIRGAGLQELRLLPGQYRLHAQKDGQPVKDEVVTVTRDGRKVVTVTLEGSDSSNSPSVAPSVEPPVGELKLLGKLDGHTDVVRTVAFLPDGLQIVSVGRDPMVRSWDVETRSVLSTLPLEGNLMRDADVSADGRFVAVVTRVDKKEVAHVWDLEKRALHCELIQDFNATYGIHISPDGTRAVTSGNPPYGVLWDLSTGKKLQRLDLGETSYTRAAAFSPDGSVVALGTAGRVWLFDGKTGNALRDVPLTNNRGMRNLEFTPSGKTLATGHISGHVSLIDVRSGRVLKTLRGSNSYVYNVRFLHSERFLLTASSDGTLRIWDIELGQLVAKSTTMKGTNNVVAVSPDGHFAVTATDEAFNDQTKSYETNGDYALRLWQLPENVWPKASNPTSSPADTTNQTPKAEPGAFVVLGGNGIAERKFDTLAEAVVGASGGDTIEIRGNGPFVSDPISLDRKALTIRAAQGQSPAIVLSAKGIEAEAYLISTDAPLVLEGLELRRPSNAGEWRQGTPKRAIIRAGRSPFYACNCRFLSRNIASVWLEGTSAGELRGCQLLEDNIGVFWTCYPDGRLVMENCILSMKNPLFVLPRQPMDALSIRIARSTLFSGSTAIVFRSPPRALSQRGDQTAKPVQVESVETVFATPNVLRLTPSFLETQAPLPLAEAENAARRLLAWKGQHNLYATGAAHQISHTSEQAPGQILYSQKTSADWKQWWGDADADRLEGAIVFVEPKSTLGPENVPATHFRLRDGHPGKAAGQGGRDLGADVDLVGPGAAYEHWKKTPEYQEWVNETKQSMVIGQ